MHAEDVRSSEWRTHADYKTKGAKVRMRQIFFGGTRSSSVSGVGSWKLVKTKK